MSNLSAYLSGYAYLENLDEQAEAMRSRPPRSGMAALSPCQKIQILFAFTVWATTTFMWTVYTFSLKAQVLELQATAAGGICGFR